MEKQETFKFKKIADMNVCHYFIIAVEARTEQGSAQCLFCFC